MMANCCNQCTQGVLSISIEATSKHISVVDKTKQKKYKKKNLINFVIVIDLVNCHFHVSFADTKMKLPTGLVMLHQACKPDKEKKN
uniref:Uncharacterized protein n=1 Tax=Glossina palpalis gambiensis TaxID=67801 RepID=A0A1B0BMF6_9MUSC